MVITTSQTKPILLQMSWSQFKSIEPILDQPGVRLSFLQDVLEILPMPGREHERLKSRIGALIELFCLLKNIEIEPVGAMTLESEVGLVRRQADEAYEFGRERASLAVEVVITSGGIDKLEAYRRLEVPEVWFWEDGELLMFQLTDVGYEPITQSLNLPQLNIELFKQCVQIPRHNQALREFQQRLKA